MRKILFFVLVLFLINTISAEQIFFDGFESGGLSGWTLTSVSGANNWTASTTNPYQGSYHAQSQPLSTTQPASVLERAISTTGYQNIIFNYSKRLIGLDIADEFQVEWYNGTTWQILEQTGGSSANDASYLSRQFSFPSTANNNPNFRIKFECTAGATSEYCRVDNVNISGDAISGDFTPPNVYLLNPQDNIKTNNATIWFGANFSDDIQLVNSTLFIWNLTNNLINITTITISGTYNITNISVILPYNSIFKWNYYACDNSSNCAFNNTNFTLTLDTIRPFISIISPANNTFTSNTGIDINYAVNDANLQACWYSNDTMTLNTTITCGQNITTLVWGEGQHNVTIWANDSAGNLNQTSVTFFVDSITPQIGYGQQTEISGSFINRNNIIVNVTATDTNLANITLYLYNSTMNLINQTTSTSSPFFSNFTNLNDGIYYFNSTSYDTVGNRNSTETRNVTIDTMPPYFTNLFSQSIYNNQSLNYDIDANDNGIGLGFFAINWTTQFSINSATGVLINISILNVGIYYINVSINDSLGNLNSSVILVNVSQSDLTPPSFSNYIENPINGSAYSQERFYQFNVTITDIQGGAIGIEFDGINYSGSDYIENISNTYTFNKTDLAAGTYNYYWWANDSSGNYNTSEIRSYTINKATSVLINLLNGINNNLTIQYPQQVNTSGFSDGGVLNIYRDGIQINNGQNYSLAAGYYRFDFNVTGNQNYTNTYGVLFANVTKAFSTTNVLVSPSLPITYGTASNFSCSNSNGLIITLYINSIDKTSENHQNIVRAAKTSGYNISCISLENQNYSGSSNETNYIINKATQTATLNINESSPIVYGTYINVTCNGELFRDDINISSEITKSVLLGSENYNYSCKLYESQNYSYGDDNLTFIVNKAVPQIELTGTSPIKYGNPVDVQGIEINSGDADLIYNLYRNSILVSNPDNEILATGNYTYEYNTIGGQNYTSRQIFLNLSVNKASSLVYAYINNTRANFTVDNRTINIYLNGSLINGEGIIGLWLNGGLINSGISQIYNITNLSVGYYNFSVVYNGNENYTLSSETFWINITEYIVIDIEYPIFGNYWDNNGSLVNLGIALFNVTVTSTNGSVLLEINGVNYTSTNLTANVYNISVNLTSNGTYNYKWYSWGNGTFNNFNSSNTMSYTVNYSDTTPPEIIVYSPENITYNNQSILINFTAQDYQSLWYYNGTANRSYISEEIITLNDGSYTFIFYANDSFGNINLSSVLFTVNVTQLISENLTMICEAGGPYQKNALILFQGNVSDNTGPLVLQEVNVSVYNSNNILNLSKLVLTSSDGSYETTFSNLSAGLYKINATTIYISLTGSCLDLFQIGGPASFVLDRIANFHSLTNNSISYNITLRIINNGMSDALYVNLTDLESSNNNYTIGNLTSNAIYEISYLKNFTRENTTTYYQLSNAEVYGIDEYSNLLISTNSTSLNLTIPAMSFGKQIIITKNVVYVSETILNISYNISSTLFNTGDEDLYNIGYIDTDIQSSAIFVNLTKGSSVTLLNLKTIAKAASNIEYEFELGSATISSLIFYSNRPKINIPGYGGPADAIVYAPDSVSASSSFDSIIQVLNINPDIGQDFTIDYWILNNDETINYSSGQRTLYVPASGQTNTTITLISPDYAGNYKLRALVSWVGGVANTFDSFEVLSGLLPTNPPSSGGDTIKTPQITKKDNKSVSESEKEIKEEGKGEKPKTEIICNFPYIRHGEECCLDENSNSICDEDEINKGITGFFVNVPDEVTKIIFWSFLIIILIIIFILVKIVLKHFRHYAKKDTTRLKNIIGLEVYSACGTEIGVIKEIILRKNKIESLRIEIRRKQEKKIKKTKIKGVEVKYKYVKSIGNIVIINERILEEMKNKEILINKRDLNIKKEEK